MMIGYSKLNKTSVPTVLLDNYIERNNHIGYVGTDNYEGIDLAVSHLYSLGHKKIAFLNGSKIPWYRTRQQSFITSMEKHGLEVNEDLIEYGYYVRTVQRIMYQALLKRGNRNYVCK